tara:strand:- start:15 stop:1784 length:1770 start_codon:yes stop_codon:yes gene_type:complete
VQDETEILKTMEEDSDSRTVANPIQLKLFDGDVFTITNNDEFIDKQICKVTESPVRSCKNIPGVLLLENNRTYGRTDNKKRLYYKCRPYDSRLPYFLIPYDLPMGFQKNFKNKYITFYFQNWNDKHPCGIISQNIGDTYDLTAYSEYRLYCKNIHDSITPAIARSKEFMQTNSIDSTMNTIINNPEKYGHFMNYENRKDIFTIDPKGTMERDDALSIHIKENGEITEYIVSVYIANVWCWLHIMNLWDVVGTRSSTIYFPDMKRPMLPTIIGEQLCSLDQDHVRLGFVMEFTVVEHPRRGVYIQHLDGFKPSYNQCRIKVSHNFDYEEKKLLKYQPYKDLKQITKILDNTVEDSNDVVAYWMIQMNQYLAKHMKYEKFGIFRVVKTRNDGDDCGTVEITGCTEEKKKIKASDRIRMIIEQGLHGKYITLESVEKYGEKLEHQMLEVKEYTHSTSPIRRIIDLLNQIGWVIHHIKPKNINSCIEQYYKKETAIDALKERTERVKKEEKVGREVRMLKEVMSKPEVMLRTYVGEIISKSGNRVRLYVSKLGWITEMEIGREEMEIGSDQEIRVYVFENEEKMSKKVRIGGT